MTDQQSGSEGAGCLGPAILLVIGAILLLPGLCVVTLVIFNFNPSASGGDWGALLSFLAVGALGALLIVLAIRLIRERRRTRGG